MQNTLKTQTSDMNIPVPSLVDLTKFVTDNEGFFDIDQKKCIEKYIKDAKESLSGRYWLKGQIGKFLNEPIMQCDIQEAIKIDKQRCGGPSTSETNNRRYDDDDYKFENLLNVLEKYYMLNR